ncbi:hypothetical protein GCM10027258_79860 [Amycolatopsis stemonae]
MNTDPAGAGPTETELTAMRDMMLGVIDFAPTDAELRTAWSNPRLASLAREWGWGDTELREELAAELEAIHRDALSTAVQLRTGRQERLLDPTDVRPVQLDEAALARGHGSAGEPAPAPHSPTGPTTASVPPRPAPPGTAATVLLIIGVAVAGGAAIVLLTWAHQLLAGLACVVAAVALIVVADRRLRRRGAARRAALNSDNAQEHGDG